jgi:hypothetical protein
MISLNKITFSEVLKSRRAILIFYIAMTLSFLFRRSRQRILKSKSRRAILTHFLLRKSFFSKKLRQRILKLKSRRAILTRLLLRKSTTLSTCLKSKKSVASKKRLNRITLQRFDIEAHSHFVSSFKDVSNKKNEKTFCS